MKVLDFNPDEVDIGKLLHTLSHHLRRNGFQEKEESGLTPVQRHLLNYILLESLSRDLYQKDIEAEFQVRRSTATGILQLLEKNGFIIRQSVAADARLKKLVPTDKAKRYREGLIAGIVKQEELLRKGLSKQEIGSCIYVLRHMLENLKESSAQKAAVVSGKGDLLE